MRVALSASLSVVVVGRCVPVVVCSVRPVL